MGKITLNDVNVPGGNNTNQVGFFNLKNDGEEAVVRIMVDSIEDMEILTTHDINVEGRFRQISCLRDPRDPMENCPFCAKGDNVKQTVFIKMLQYENTPNGVEVKPVVWQRNANTYAFRIKGYLDNYGPLSSILCKIVRHGARGDMKTTYDIMPNLNPTQFPQESYPIKADAFKNYSALGSIVLDKTKEEINTFISTGKFPEQGSQMTMGDTTENIPRGPVDDELPFNPAQGNQSVLGANGISKPNRYY